MKNNHGFVIMGNIKQGEIMSREKTLVKNTLIMALGTFLPRIINLLTTPIITSATTDAVSYTHLDVYKRQGLA